jgi:hypothetical protein
MPSRRFWKLSSYQLKKLSDYWLDISKLAIASLIIKFFEPDAPRFTISSALTMIGGLLIAIIFAILGLKFSRKVKQ